VPAATEPQSSIPEAQCPLCGATVRLARVGPVTGDEETMIFNCECGFEYHQSAEVRADRQAGKRRPVSDSTDRASDD
jgi:hypothetical protein